jgi:hypothetical protein
MKRILLTIILGLSTLLVGCVFPKSVSFTSAPAGATVKYLDKDIGVTPFTKDVYDQVGWYSVYEFQATKPGFQPDTQKFYEKSISDHNNVVPDSINFVLKSN